MSGNKKRGRPAKGMQNCVCGYSTEIPNFNPEEVIDQCMLICSELEKDNIDYDFKFIKNTSKENNIKATNTINPNKIGNNTVQQKDIN